VDPGELMVANILFRLASGPTIPPPLTAETKLEFQPEAVGDNSRANAWLPRLAHFVGALRFQGGLTVSRSMLRAPAILGMPGTILRQGESSLPLPSPPSKKEPLRVLAACHLAIALMTIAGWPLSAIQVKLFHSENNCTINRNFCAITGCSYSRPIPGVRQDKKE
jgi:hypothetical protein